MVPSANWSAARSEERRLEGHLAWDSSGRWLAAGILFAAALYELSPLKDVCLRKCQSPLGFLLGSWRRGLSGAARMGTKHGAWCVGCCWALMAALFAIGIMNLAGMAFIAALIAAEKLLPWHRTVTYGTAVILALLGVLVVVAPHAIPGPHRAGRCSNDVIRSPTDHSRSRRKNSRRSSTNRVGPLGFKMPSSRETRGRVPGQLTCPQVRAFTHTL